MTDHSPSPTPAGQRPHSVSIIIPTHNRADLLGKTLDSLAQLEVPQSVAVHLVVVANACTDNTPAVVECKAPALPFPARCVVEPIANLSRARNCGIKAATGEILAMLDDDVWCAREWLTGLVDAYATLPADLVGGKVTLWWEAVDRPAWFTPAIENVLSACNLGEAPLELTDAHGPTSYFQVIGANYSFHRRVVDAIGGFTPGLGRTGTALLGSEETDFSLRALTQGFRLFYAPGAPIQHWVPPERATAEYVCSAAYGHAFSGMLTQEDLRWPEAGRIFRRMGLRVVRSALRELFWAAGGNRSKMVENRIRRKVAAGRVAGAYRNLAGGSPVQLAERPTGEELQ